MLNELLVLGQVPGTNFQITFTDLILIFDLVVLFLTLDRYHQIVQKTHYYRLYCHLLFAIKKEYLTRLWHNGLSVKV